MSHYVNKCKHGTLMGQCRCFGPKPTRIVPCPPSHDNWLPVGDDVSVNHAPPVYPEPTLAAYGADVERKRIVAFLREKARELQPFKRGGSLALVQAALLDAADWIQNGDHVQ